MPRTAGPATVLFDLDGTLVDTAPDLAWALNEVRARWGLAALPYDKIRPGVSHGSVALTRIALSTPESDPAFERFRLELLDTYQANIAQFSRLFDGMEEVLRRFDANAVAWGVVTNKPAYLTTALMRALELDVRTPVVISGDTLAQAKPHPAPLLLAAERLGKRAHECVYVGDAERDIVAGKAAGMRTVLAAYGYLNSGDEPERWGADGFINKPLELAAWLGLP